MKADYEHNEKFGLLLAKARTKHNISQTAMAKRMGISRKTLINWETAVSAPQVADMFKWFRELGENPEPYLKEYLYEDANGNSEDPEENRRRLMLHMEGLSDQEVAALNFIFSGQHGGSSYAFLQMCLAYLQCPMGDRQSVASTITNNYRNALAMGTLTDETQPQPDMKVLDRAVEEGRNAYINNLKGYFIVK